MLAGIQSRIFTTIACLGLGGLVLIPFNSAVGAVLIPDDLALRSDIQLLADAGLLTGPVSAWPLSVAALRKEMRTTVMPDNYRPHIRNAWQRVMRRISARPTLHLKLAAINEPVVMRRFSDTPRGSGATATLRLEKGVLNLTLSTTLQERGRDGQRARLDGSQAAIRAGNWQFAVGQLPRWWGPSYESSLILSTNARPVPAFSIDTVEALQFKSPWLNWLGPMHWSVFAGEMESDRFIPGVRLLGARISLRPLHKLEIGLSRTAQWGGSGRPESISSLIDLILGRDNLGDAGITRENEPGNQLGGVDVRYLSPFGDAPYALYSQFVGEDEAGGLPSRLIGLAGAEYWQGFGDGTLRVFAEAANTTVEFYKSMSRKDVAYEHGIYRTGYRYRGRSIGHAIDNDGFMLSLGGIWTNGAAAWEGVIRRVDVNTNGRLGSSPHTVSVQALDQWELWLATTRVLPLGTLRLGVASTYVNPVQTATKIDSSVFISWERDWGSAER